MPKRTIRVAYYTTEDGVIHQRGEEVDLSTKEAERGDKLNAFEETVDAPVGRRQGVEPPSEEELNATPEGAPEPYPAEDEGEPFDLANASDEDIENLRGTALDDAVRDAEIEGWSKLSAADKRKALVSARDAS